MKVFRNILIAAVVMLTAPAHAQEDIDGASDHPLVGRYEGSVITYHQVKSYEETYMPRAPITRQDRDNAQAKSVSVSGKLTAIRYEGPAGRSALEVVRNYQQALEGNGFATVFECRQDSCGYTTGFWGAARGDIGLLSNWESNTYALMKLDRSEGAVWVSVFAIEQRASGDRPLTPHVALRVVEEKSLETGKIALVKAGKLAEAIGVDGRIALYGIEFDYDSDVVKPASGAQIAEVAKYLESNPSANVLVVGHTDTTGAFAYNRALSERRAAAVVKKLTDVHDVTSDRMFAVGVGPASPIATNRTEEGRARNRRVEIVDLPKAQ